MRPALLCAASAAAVAAGPGQTIWDAACVAGHCAKETAACGLNKVCRTGLLCITGCKRGDQTCIFQCQSDYENDVLVGLMRCMFTTHDCTGGMATFDPYQTCRGTDKAPAITQYRGKDLTPEAARQLLVRGQHRGDWMVAAGLAGAYDCFDCQYLYYGDNGDSSLEYVADYKVNQSSGSVRWNLADYKCANAAAAGAHFEPAQPGRLSCNASDYAGLFHAEDWRVIAIDEKNDQPQWVAMYYCGGAPGVLQAYEGSSLLTIDGKRPTDADAVSAYTAAYAAAGITLGCTVDNSQCSGHPDPPIPPN